MMGALVDTISTWVWLAAGLVAICGGMYGASKWFKTQFRDAVSEVVAPMIAPVNDKLEHLHDCVERVGSDAVRNAAAAAAAAREAVTAATEAQAVVKAHADDWADHTAQDAVEFGQITDWRAEVDVTLEQIQQTQKDG